jgi:predicted TIM-barrel fold metal-dependent hydrolase
VRCKGGHFVTTVIDVDAHFDVPITPETHPFRDFADRLPARDRFIADQLVGDLLRHCSEGSRPEVASVIPFLPDENTSSAEQATEPGKYAPRFPILDIEDRIAWLDRVGIDHVFLNPGGYAFLLPYLEGESDAIPLCNDFMADRLEGFTDRLVPVSLIDWTSLDHAIQELTRMRSRGSRAFWVKAEPFNGMSAAHPDLDRLWSAATDLGMIAVLHVGNAGTRFDAGWANAGWNLDGSTGSGGFFRFANAFRNHAAEMLIGAMVFGGVFGRHPNLTIITEELGVSWLPHFVNRCSLLDLAGNWPFDLSPSEMMHRNVRSSPLMGLGDPNVLDGLIDELSDMIVFSSDYPHGEGNADPLTLYEPQLSKLDADLRAEFLGENIAACFARMGDPLKR